MSSRKVKAKLYRRAVSDSPSTTASPPSSTDKDESKKWISRSLDDCTDAERGDSSQSEGQKMKDKVIKEGWATKESGQAFLGKHNWKRRFFRLVQRGHLVTFSYFVHQDDMNPKGQVLLTQEYAAREIELGEKAKPNCFALGPLLDSSALRTYYVSCDNDDEKLDWITLINSTLEGVPEKAMKRKTTYRVKKEKRAKGRRSTYPASDLPFDDEAFPYLKQMWRMQQWNKLHHLAKRESWKRWEVKNGVTIARQSFKSSEMAIIKVEGLLPAPQELVFEFLQRSLQLGGKEQMNRIFQQEHRPKLMKNIENSEIVSRAKSTLDQSLSKEINTSRERGGLNREPGTEELLQKLQDQRGVVDIISNEYEVPLPGTKPRDVCLFRMWISSNLTRDGTSGLLIHSVYHPGCLSTKDHERVDLDPSGVVLQEVTTTGMSTDGKLQTKATFIVQIDLKSSLQNMLRGSYKSGLLRKGLRNSFHHLSNYVALYRNLIYMEDLE